VFFAIYDNRKVICAVFLCAIAIAIPGLLRLELSPDNRVFYSTADSKYQTLLEFEAIFRPSSSISFVVTASDPIESDAAFARALQWLTQEAGNLPYAERIESLATIQHLQESGETIHSATKLAYLCEPQCDVTKSPALDDPWLLRRYVSEDHITASVVVSLDFDVKTVDAVTSIDTAAKKLMVEFSNLWPTYQILKTGTVPLMQSYVDATFRDLTGTLLLAMATIFTLMWFVLGNLRMTLIMLSLGGTTIGVTMGIAGYAGLVIVTSTATIPLIIFTVVTASSMHLLLHVARGASLDAQLDIKTSVARALEANWQPILLTTTTTVFGLFSLNFVDSQPIREIGNWASLGVLIGTALTLIVMPLATVALVTPGEARLQQWIQSLLNRYARIVETRGTSTWAFIALFAICGYGLFHLKIDDDFVRYLRPDNPFRIDTEYAAGALSSLNQLDLWLISEPEKILSPESVSLHQDLVNYVRAHPFVSNATSVVDVLENVNIHFGTKDDLMQYNTDEISQLFWAYELSLSDTQSSGDLISPDFGNSRVSVLLHDVASAGVRQFAAETEDWFQNRDNSSSNFKLHITGEAFPISFLSTRNIPTMIKGISLSLLLSAILLGWFYRNVRIAAVGFVATVVPVICGFGVYGFVSDSIGLAATVIVAVAVGVVIDDAIHMIYRHQDGRANLDLSPIEASAYSIHRAGSAVVSTTIILVGGFVTLMSSSFGLNGTFGLCTGIILVAAMLFDLFSLPKLLVWSAR